MEAHLTGLDESLAAVWRALGLTPTALSGFGVGQFVVSVLAGRLSLKKAVHAAANKVEVEKKEELVRNAGWGREEAVSTP